MHPRMGKSVKGRLPKRAVGPADATDFTWTMDNRLSTDMARPLRLPPPSSATILYLWFPSHIDSSLIKCNDSPCIQPER
jgi:hypothetical protein